ncbi:glutaredoxin 2 isoform X1 [Cervus elaphus]|uniref:glutaredoxin 2 isoform X1 n=1 Tax=Cervus elaphus TaxID=9860 RepID=UPI001CC310A1|nr:glutaredoxin 2 isoform X1 [Cervus elaphus]
MYWRRAALVGTRLVRVRSSSAGRLEGPAGISGSGMGNSTSSSLGNAATAPVNQIQETISNNCVVIFSKTSCSYCTMAKKLFHDMNVNYKVVELDMLEYGSQFQDALHKMTGERTVPRIFVNGTFIGGATDTHRLHKEGKLLPLVHQCHLKKSDKGSIPRWGRSSGEGNGNPLQYSCLENPTDRGVWMTIVRGITRVGHDLATK